jgi:hypothetical protein
MQKLQLTVLIMGYQLLQLVHHEHHAVAGERAVVADDLAPHLPPATLTATATSGGALELALSRRVGHLPE